MSKLMVLEIITVPSNNCQKCRFHIQKNKYNTRLNAYGRPMKEIVKTEHRCLLFETQLDGCKKCPACKESEVYEAPSKVESKKVQPQK